MRLADKLRLGRDVQDPIAVPVMARACDQVLGVQIARLSARRRVVAVVTHIQPDVDVAVNQRQPVSADLEVAVGPVVGQVRARRDCVEGAGGKGPVAPLLGVVDLQDARDERGSGGGRDLIGALFGAGAVEIGAEAGVGRVGEEVGYISCVDLVSFEIDHAV